MAVSEPPSWALFDVDLATVDEDELGALIDDVIDSGKSLAFRDTRESEDIRAVCISWDAYVGLIARGLPKADQIEREVDAKVRRDIYGDILR